MVWGKERIKRGNNISGMGQRNRARWETGRKTLQRQVETPAYAARKAEEESTFKGS